MAATVPRCLPPWVAQSKSKEVEQGSTDLIVILYGQNEGESAKTYRKIC